MKRLVIIVAALPFALGACGGDGSDAATDGGSTAASSSPSVDAASAAFCDTIDTYKGQLEQDLEAGGNGLQVLTQIQQTSTSAVEILSGQQDELTGDAAFAADDVVSAISGLANWTPDEGDIDDTVNEIADAIEVFAASHC